jgi:hypothetical protein
MIKLVTILTILCVLTQIVAPEYTTRAYNHLCDESMPNLSQGDVHLTDDNYEHFTNKYKNKGVFILAASDSSCIQCCHSERLIS